MDIVTAWVSMLLEKLIVAKLVTKFLVFSGTRGALLDSVGTSLRQIYRFSAASLNQ
jgi:hypothetical protein